MNVEYCMKITLCITQPNVFPNMYDFLMRKTNVDILRNVPGFWLITSILFNIFKTFKM